MEMIGLFTIIVPFIGALVILFSPKTSAKWICQIFAALATLGTWFLASRFFVSGADTQAIPLMQIDHILILDWWLIRSVR